MRAKFINEKFQEISDPVKDMGIGVLALRKRFIKELNAFKKEVKRKGDPFRERGLNDGFDFIETELNNNENTLNLKVIIKHLKKEIKGWDEVLPYLDRAEHVPGIKSGLETVLGFVEGFNSQYLKESFSETSDPIHDMNIGVINIREFDTIEEAAEVFVNHVKTLTKGRIENPEELRDLFNRSNASKLKDGELSPLAYCNDYLKGWHDQYPRLVVHGMSYDITMQRLQFLKDFKDSVKEYLILKYPHKYKFNVDIKR